MSGAGAVRALSLGLALLATLVAGPARAQGTPVPAAGTPDPVHNAPFALGTVVRIVARSLGSDPVVGRVDSVRGEWVVLDTVAPRIGSGLFQSNVVPIDQLRFLSVRAQDLRTVEVLEGTSKVRGVLLYGSIGAGVLGLVGGLSNGQQGISSAGGSFGQGFMVGVVAGGIIGGGLGYLSGRDRWRLVPGPYYVNAPR